MKIVQIGPFPENINLIKGGVEASVYGLSKALSLNNEVTVFDFPNSNYNTDFEDVINDIKVLRFYKNGNSNFTSILRIPRIIEELKKKHPNILHIHGTSYFNLLLILVVKVLTYKYILTVHGLTHEEKRNVYLKSVNIKSYVKYLSFSISEFLILSITKHVIVDTQYVADKINQYYLNKKILHLPKLYIIPQGIDDSFFKIVNINQKNILLSIGAFIPRKGHHFLIETAKLIKERNFEFQLKIIGVKSDSNYFIYLEKLISEYNLHNFVELLPNVDNQVIFDYYSKSKIFILHSEEESQGIVFCQALASGLPVVSTKVGGIPYVIKDNINGFLTTFTDVNLFAEEIINLLQNENLLIQIRNQNIVDSKHYDWNLISNKISTLYSKL